MFENTGRARKVNVFAICVLAGLQVACSSGGRSERCTHFDFVRNPNLPPCVLGASPVTAKAFKVEPASGINRMARRMRNVLNQYRIAVNRFNNQHPYQHLNTEIQNRIGYQQEADALKNVLRGYAVVASGNNLSGNSDLRLVPGALSASESPLNEATN